MKNNKEIENILLNNKEYDNFINSKIEKDFANIFSQKKETPVEINDIKKVPKDMLFSKRTTFRALNKQNKTQSYINGVQAEGFLADQNAVREKLLSGDTDSFVCEDIFIKFFKYRT